MEKQGSNTQQGLWQDGGRGSGIEEAMLQDLTITPHCLASVASHRHAEINNGMSDSNRKTAEKERAVNTHRRFWLVPDCFAKQVLRYLVSKHLLQH